MRIAVHLPQASPTTGGGFTFQESLQKVIGEVAHGSAHEFLLFTEAPPQPGTELASIVSIPSSKGARLLRRAQFLANHAQDTWLQRRYVHFENQFDRLLKAHKIDVVWFSTHGYFECEVPYIYTVWDVQHRYQPWFPEVGAPGVWHARENAMRRALCRAACVIVPNRQGADELAECYALDRPRILELAHPTPEFALEHARNAPKPRPAELDFGGKYLLYPAQFWAHKNHVTLLRAFKLLLDGGSDLHLVLVGSDKGNRTHVENVARELGVLDRVRMLGFVPTDTLVGLYQHAACLTYTSFFGPENLPPLEAFALGCPVVAANYLGADEQLGNAALLVSHLDPQELADAIRRLLDNEALRNELVARGRKRAESYTARDYLKGVITFLDQFSKVRANWG